MRHLLRRLTTLPARLRHVYLQTMGIDKGTQLLLAAQYQDRYRVDQTPARLRDVEFRCYSQNGEDGILWYLFSLIGWTNKTCVEVCAGNGIQCNSANLIINHGWTGLLFDGSDKLLSKGRSFYAAHPDTCAFPPRLVAAWITSKNINDLIRSHGMQGSIDLLSLDMDGVDYWVWAAIEVIRPRVVVAEVQIIWGPEAAVSVPNDDEFVAEYQDGCGIYCGASIEAFTKLARAKGYRLVGCQQYGFNAFFLRDDVGVDIFKEVLPADCLRHPFAVSVREKYLPLIKERPWVEV